MTASIEPVVIPNTAGQRLYGMLHRPPSNRAPGLAVVLLSPGIKGRVAPHRLYMKLARRLTDAGFAVLRFDFYGLGDAEGELGETLVADVYGAVSVGRYVEDTVAAMDWLQHEHQLSKFVLGGLCGGAITGLYAGARDPRVAALIGFAIPVIQYSSNSTRFQYFSTGEQNQFRRGYLRRLLDWKSWLRLLTFRSDFSVIARVFLGPLLGKWKRKPAQPADTGARPEAGSDEVAGNLNASFPPAFFRMLNSTSRMFLIFGETDRLYWDFNEKFYQRRRSEIESARNHPEIHVVPQARHIFEEQEHQQDLFNTVVGWLEREYGGASVPPRS